MKIKMSHVGLLDLFNTATPARLPKIVMKSTTKVIVVADMFPCSIGTRDCRRARRASRRGPRIPSPARTGITSRYVHRIITYISFIEITKLTNIKISRPRRLSTSESMPHSHHTHDDPNEEFGSAIDHIYIYISPYPYLTIELFLVSARPWSTDPPV